MDIQTQIDLIADEIIDEECVLLLGPNLWLNEAGQSFYQSFKNSIETNQALKVHFDADNLVKFEDSQSKRAYIRQLKNYFQNPELVLPEFYTQIAQMPFHLIISATPDLFLKKTMQKNGIPHQFAFYDKGSAPAEVEKPTKETPLLYNLFGNLEEDDSLLLTQHDIFDFIFAILDDKKLPREIKSVTKSANLFIFLGFDLERWYIRIILRLLDLHQENALPYLDETNQLHSQIQNFYIETFDAKFIPLDSKDLIQQLFEALERKKALKPLSQTSEHPLISELQDLLAQNNLNESLRKMKNFLREVKDDEDAEDLMGKVLMQTGRLQDLQERIEDGIITTENASVEQRTLSQAIFKLVQKLKEYLDGKL